MGNVQGASSWRELLQALIEDGNERQRIARAIDIHPITLQRWVNSTTKPHEEHMRKLLNALPPPHAATFARFVAKEFPHLIAEEHLEKRIQNQVPAEFYREVLSVYTSTSPPLCRQAILDLVFQQAIEHLDPDRRGMSISIATFVPPLEGLQVRSMREIGGMGTPPWPGNLAQKTMFLGAESLVGNAITKLRSLVVSNRGEASFFPVQWTEHEQSAVAVPILRRGKVAGGLIVASTIPDYFVPGHVTVSIVESYAQLSTLLFEEEELFHSHEIALGCMPVYEVQFPYFRDFHKRVSQQFRLAQICGSHCTLEQARRQVWREIEEELLQAFWQTATEIEV